MSIVSTGGSGVARRRTPGQWEYRKEELQLFMALLDRHLSERAVPGLRTCLRHCQSVSSASKSAMPAKGA